MRRESKNQSTGRDRALLILAACAVLGIVAVADWQLINARIPIKWRDYLLYNACLSIVAFMGMRSRVSLKGFRVALLIALVFHWILSALFTHLGLSFLWSGILGIGEIFVLNSYWRRTSGKAVDVS